MFEIVAERGRARAGRITINGRTLETPAFLPVATKGCVKTLTPEEVYSTGCRALIVNALHLYRRVFEEASAAGLHAFMGWEGLIFTDSGGFQSIKKFPAEVTDEGVIFRMPDGKEEVFTPEKSIEIQEKLGSDFIFALDDCPSYPYTRERVEESVARTIRWAYRCQGERHFAILQGGTYEDLRLYCSRAIAHLDFFGFAIGGLCIGEPKEEMHKMAEASIGVLPPEKPRHLMGVGSPEDILTGVDYGVDIFDSAFPTRNARHGTIFTSTGKINLGKKKVRGDVIDEECGCYACRNFSLDYLNHLFKEKEPLAMRLATIHNLSFMSRLMSNIREEITG